MAGDGGVEKLHRIGLIGNRAHQMLWAPIFHQRSDCRIVAAAEHDAEKGRALEQFGVRCATDYDAVFDDPDVDIATLADLLHETAEHHDPYEKSSPPHDWWDWYAAYISARQSGSTEEQASTSAARYMEEAGLVPR